MRYGLRALLIGLFLCGAASATVYWRYYKLPHPNQANQNQIAYWLVIKDVSRQREEIQIALVDRLIDDEHLFSSGGDSNQLTASQTERLRKNIDRLKYVWFADRVKKYAALPESRRHDFLRKQIEVVETWATLMSENEDVLNPECEKGEQINYSAMLFDEVEHWLEMTPPEEHDQAYAAVKDAVQCWLAIEPLSKQSIETRRELVARIARELNSGTKIDGINDSLSPVEQAQLAENCDLLVEAWVNQLADDLDRVKDKKARATFVDSLIADIQSWGVVSVLPSSGNGDGSIIQGFMFFAASAEKWIERAGPEQQEKLRKLISLARSRIVSMVWKKAVLQ